MMCSEFMLKLCWQPLQQSGVLSLLSPLGGCQIKLKLKSPQSPEAIHHIKPDLNKLKKHIMIFSFIILRFQPFAK